MTTTSPSGASIARAPPYVEARGLEALLPDLRALCVELHGDGPQRVYFASAEDIILRKLLWYWEGTSRPSRSPT